jgi:plastocyanin
MKVLRNLTIAMLVAAVACGGSDGSTGVTNPPTGGNQNPGTPSGGNDTPVATNQVGVSDNTFSPASIVVSAGTTVTWTWAAGAAPHNVTFSDGNNSGDKSTGTFSRTFSTAGTFNYSCTLHSGMNGTVKVN